MWRWVTRGLVLGCLLLLFPAAAFSQQFVGVLETPQEGETVSGMVLVRGFGLDAADISRVDLFVDDQFQHSANINIPRIDVIQTYPDYEGIQTRRPGFMVGFSASRFSNGPHTIHVRIVTGDNRSFEVGRRTILVNNSINQGPFGSVDIPDTSAIFDVNGSFPIVGWAADIDGIRSVDVLIDNLNHQAAVYGDPRPDVGNTFPDLPSALLSGFVAHIDTTRLTEGVHSLSVRITDRLGLAKILRRQNIQVFNSTNNLRPFGYLDEPLRDATLYGTCNQLVAPCQVSPCPPNFQPSEHITLVRGWALDLGSREDTGRVAYAELLVDGARITSTDNCRFDTNLNAYVDCKSIPRFDVQRYYPNYPDSPRAGYVFALDIGELISSGFFRVGGHTMKIRVGDQEQTFADIPNTAGIPVFFTCSSDRQDFASLGYIDYPTKFEFLNGTVTFFGWALDENIGVQNVELLVDGTLIGMAQYGIARTDVQSAYPTIFNSLFSGWRFTFDTRQLSDARHTLTVQVLDRFNNRSIIGSVEFFVDNPN